MIKETDKTVSKQQYEWLREYQWKEGESGNPNGRPKGSISIKDLVRKHLETHPDDLIDFVKHFIETNRELAWQMMEGRPYQDILSGGEKLPVPILNVFTNNSDNQDKEINQKDTSSAGGDISK